MFLAGEEESTSFLKKRSKKLLLIWAEGRGRRRSPWPKVIKVFLLLFVHKKKTFPHCAFARAGWRGGLRFWHLSAFRLKFPENSCRRFRLIRAGTAKSYYVRLS
jgi:hypothetical protein